MGEGARAHLWKPGQSGNPGGRIKKLKDLEDGLLSEFGPKVREVMARIYELIMDDDSKKVAPAAAKLFIERLMGAPKQVKDPGEEDAPDQLTDRELWERVLSAPAVREVVLAVIEGGKK